MGTRRYQKLVRDYIPRMIADGGETPVTSILSGQVYEQALSKKLLEETREFLEPGEAEELADILEVVYAIAELRGIGVETLETIRLEKRSRNGDFSRGIYLDSVISGED